MLYIFGCSNGESNCDDNALRGYPCLQSHTEDWPFMEASAQTLCDMPETWMRYPQNTQGISGIIDMEYTEFKKATSKEDICHELVDLASACLYMWRKLHDI